METEEIFYTDGQDIVITSSVLQVGERLYNLKDIRGRSLAIVQPARTPGIIVFLTGVVLSLFGMADGFPAELARGVMDSKGLDINLAAQWTGMVFTFLGLVASVLLREKYAVRIATEDGAHDAVVSAHKEYINEILDALNRVDMDADMNAHRRLRRG